MANLLRVRAMVQQTLARQDAERTNQFLYAASQGDVAKIRQVSPMFYYLFKIQDLGFIRVPGRGQFASKNARPAP